MGYLNTKDRIFNANEYAKVLRRRYDLDTLRTLFMERELDDEFREIGEAALGYSISRDPHIAVWTGFEIAVESVRSDYLPGRFVSG